MGGPPLVEDEKQNVRSGFDGTHPGRSERRHLGTPTGKRIVLTAGGSLGDVLPLIAVALGLKARGHDAVVATGECYRRQIESLGLGFRAGRPDSDWVKDPDVMERMMDGRWGTFRILREIVLPALRESYHDALAAAQGADLLVGHPLCFATRLVAEKEGIPWASSTHSPTTIFSAYDPQLIPGFPEVSKRLRWLGPIFWRGLQDSQTGLARLVASA